jgi:signal transduction histidine kinase
MLQGLCGHRGPDPVRVRVRVRVRVISRLEARTGSRDGVGLGLFITRSVATAHDADETVRSQPEGGLDVSVVIPDYR